MKKALLTMFVLTLWLALVSGATMSFFTAQAEGGPIPFTTGTVEVHADAMSVGGGDNWTPANPLDIGWLLQNNGTKTAYLRAKIATKWLINSEGMGSETAWAGITTVPNNHPDYAQPISKDKGGDQGNVSRYFTVDPESLGTGKTIAIAVGKPQDVIGSATLSTEGSNLIIQLDLEDGWRVDEDEVGYQAHLHIVDTVDFPNNNGHMNYTHTFDAAINRFVVPLVDIKFNPMFIAIHLGITKATSSGTVELPGDINTIWTLTEPNWTLGGDGWWYYCGIVQPGEVVPLSFQVTLTSLNLDDDMTLRGAEYTADLTVEAIQTTHGAVE